MNLEERLDRAGGGALAAYAVLYAFLKQMLQRGLLTPAEVSHLLDNSLAAIEGGPADADTAAARRILEGMLNGLLPGRGDRNTR